MISLWVYLFVIIAAVAKAAMDKLQFHFYNSIFSEQNHFFWNPDESWKNKWKNGNVLFGEKFPFSSTILVFLTDGWHLMQFIFLNTFFLALFLIALQDFNYSEAIVQLILLRALFGLVFELHFKYIFAIKL
jgi:hypothetical protein